MVRTASSMLTLGTAAPHFCLEDVQSGEMIALDAEPGVKASVIMFICNHCPYVKHVISGIVDLAREYQAKGIRFIAINSNDASQYPDDSPENMKRLAKADQYPFPYLFDATQEVARAYQAACTPDFYVFDEALSLVYRGQLDDSRPGNKIPVTGASIRQALDEVLANRPVPVEQKPSLGCNIKWR
ncbi:MAG: thioredoxin family protein [Methylococcales bacterium]|nr:thioredoxin family protein [Methylococcales bacterium]